QFWSSCFLNKYFLGLLFLNLFLLLLHNREIRNPFLYSYNKTSDKLYSKTLPYASLCFTARARGQIN
ncbi:unnamed protein product, partial [Prunus brigantina]